MRCVLLKRPWIRSYVAGLLGFSIVKLDSFFWSKERGPVLGVRCSQQSPKYTSKDVKNHNTIQKGVWISYEGRVYDITGFIDRHPGGKIIMQAAGKDLGPFFEKFKFHKTENIIKMLDEYLIGELEDLEPPKPMPPPEKQMNEFSSEPTRSEHLIVNSGQPFNAETPVTALIDNFYTPNEVFFVRNHMPVPQIDPATHKISFCTQRKYLMDYLEEDFVKEELDVRKGFKQEILCKSLNIFDLINKYEHLDVEATLQCTGNRRDGMNTVKPVVGIPWKGGAIGNALWKGVRLHDVLSDLGISVDGIKSQKAHVMMIGADKNSVDEHYEVSVPLRFAIQPNTILAFKMNGTDLPPDHGYPVRMIIPGITGARNVKWLQKVIVIDMESQSIWQQEDYRCYSPDKTRISRADIDVPAILEMPITSMICHPPRNAVINLRDREKTIPVKGYSFSGGGRGVARVELSIDGGNTWVPAKLWPIKDPSQPIYGWTFWSANLSVPDTQNEMEIICKAVDTSYNHQPESAGPIWNFRGLLNNSWHRINIKIER